MLYDFDDSRTLSDLAYRDAQQRDRDASELRDWHVWPRIDANTAGPHVAEANDAPISFGHELSTTQLIAARFGRRGRRA